jgi:predicted nucleotidyltransferase
MRIGSAKQKQTCNMLVMRWRLATTNGAALLDLIPGRRQITTRRKKAAMLSARRRQSLNSVVIKSIDKERVREAVLALAARLRQEHPESEQIIWFGSWVTGIPTPGSDVDLCLIVTSSDELPRDRISKYLPVGFPVGMDLFAYTKDEFARLKDNSPGWYEAICSGIRI